MSDLESNSKFNYLYRDGANYKVWGYEVFSNPELLTRESIERGIRSLLIDGEFFDRNLWRVKRLKQNDWIPE